MKVSIVKKCMCVAAKDNELDEFETEKAPADEGKGTFWGPLHLLSLLAPWI